MKLLITTVAISVLLNGVTLAAEPVRRDYTVEQINKALEFQGRPPLGSSRVLHDDSKQERTSVILSTSHIDSKSTITSK